MVLKKKRENLDITRKLGGIKNMFRLTTKRGTFIYETDNAYKLMVASGVAGMLELEDADLYNDELHDALEQVIESAHNNPEVTIDVVDSALWNAVFDNHIDDETPTHIKIQAMNELAEYFEKFGL